MCTMVIDGDEIREFYGFSYKSSDGCYGLEENITKKAEVSFEGRTVQDVIDHFHLFLNTIGFSYIGEIEMTSKDGTKTWRTDGADSRGE